MKPDRSPTQPRIRMGDLSQQYLAIKHELMATWLDSLENAMFIGGREVANFESKFSDFLGGPFVAGVANGTDALEIILQALSLNHGERVLVQANSFVASAEAVLNVGLQLGFVDVNKDFSIDLINLEKELKVGAAALIVVHLYGHPQPMSRILSLTEKYGVKVIEDCAQAHGTTFDGITVGTIGDAGAFSFYPGKNLGAFGDAGAVVTKDPDLFARVRRISNHGRLSKYDHDIRGRNSRLDSLQASALTLKLSLLTHWNQLRQRNAARYRSNLDSYPGIVLPPHIEGSTYHHFVVQVEDRNELQKFLSSKGIETGIHYPTALSQLKYLGSSDFRAPNAEYLASRILSLPVAEHLNPEDIDSVSSEIKHFLC